MAEITNSANVSYTFSGSSSSQQATSNVTQTNVTYSSSVDISKMVLSSGFIPGENISFMIRVTNTGTDTLSDVVVTDNLGAYNDGTRAVIVPLEYVDGTAAQSVNHGAWSMITPSSTNPLVFNIGTMESGDVVEITYTTGVSDSFEGSEISSVSTVEANGASCEVSDSSTVTIDEASFAHIVVTKAGSTDDISTGEDFTYTINIVNNGNIDATGIVVTDYIPSDFLLENVNMVQNGTTTPLTPVTDYTLQDGLLTIPTSGSSLSLVVAPEGSSTNDGLSFELVGRFSN